MAKNRFNVSEVAAMLTECRGLVTYTAKRLGCHPSTVWEYIRKYTACREAREIARDSFVDDAEVGLMAAVKAGQPWAIQFALNNQGRHRGYGRPLEINVTNSDTEVMKARIEDTVDIDEYNRAYLDAVGVIIEQRSLPAGDGETVITGDD